MLKEFIITESIRLIYELAKLKLKNTSFELNADYLQIEEALNHHITIVKNWSSEINFKDLKTSKTTFDVYIPLDLYLYPLRNKIEQHEEIQIIPLLDIFKFEKSHLAILGQPGAGKTTSLKFFCQSILFSETFYPDLFKYPILIRLRDFNKQNKSENAGIIIEYLFDVFGLKLKKYSRYTKSTPQQLKRLKEVIVLDVLEKLNVLVVIDGFDELPYKSHRDIIIQEVAMIANYLEKSRIIITSRIADYVYSNENISVYEICPLNDKQIVSFAEKWLGEEQSKKFINDISISPYKDTSIRPLTIAHLCAIFERIGKIPEKPKTVYRKIINLLLEEWDEQRSVKRNSKYALFEIDRKFEFLSNLAFHLTSQNGKTLFNRNDLNLAYNDIYSNFDLERSEVNEVINDIESHTGLFIQVGYVLFEFAHKSLQEYLCAEYIVKLPKIPDNKRLLERMPNEMAISVTISSNPSMYFVELIDNIFLRFNFGTSFIQKFINRLIIEKPDFYQSIEVAISALKLYSLYFEKNYTRDGQLSLFNTDILLKEFEDLIDVIFARNSKEIVNSIYCKEGIIETLDQTIVLKMKLIEKQDFLKVKNTLKKIKYEALPKIIYCRDSFV